MIQDSLKLIGRLLIAALFIPAGFQTLSDIAAAAGYFQQLGLPLPTLAAWGVGIFELLAGALIFGACGGDDDDDTGDTGGDATAVNCAP